MNFFKSIILKIKKIFNKHEDIKMLEESKIINNSNAKDEFIENLKVNINKVIKKKKVETLICPGDGLGINNKITS